MRFQEFVAPAALLELRIKEDRFPIEMADQGGVDVAAFDGAQDRDHRLRRLHAAQVEVHGVGGAPHPGPVLRASMVMVVTHGKAPF